MILEIKTTKQITGGVHTILHNNISTKEYIKNQNKEWIAVDDLIDYIYGNDNISYESCEDLINLLTIKNKRKQ